MLTDDYYLQLAQNLERESNEIERQQNYKKYEQLYSYQV
jgi:hypothetical protein